MLIDCPACARSYHVSRADIGEEGRAVICPRCEAQWFVDGDGTAGYATGEDIHASTVSARPDRELGPPGGGDDAVRRSVWRYARPVAAAATCLMIGMAALGARDRIVRLVPRTAGLYAALGLPVNVRGLAFAAVTPTRVAESPSEVTISGEIRNVAKARVAVPHLTYEIRDGAGAPLVTWTERPAARTLASGRTLPFISTPHHMPPDARSVLIRFEDGTSVLPLIAARRTPD